MTVFLCQETETETRSETTHAVGRNSSNNDNVYVQYTTQLLSFPLLIWYQQYHSKQTNANWKSQGRPHIVLTIGLYLVSCDLYANCNKTI